MAICSKCKSESSGRFCAQCGAPTIPDSPPSVWGNEIPKQAADAPRTGHYASSEFPNVPPANPPYSRSGTNTVLDDNIASALCYSLWFLTGVLFLVLEPYNRNKAVRFHAFQAIFTGGAVVGGFWLLTTLAFTPMLGLLFSFTLLIYPLAATALWVILMYKAYNKERWVLPVIGPLAEKQA